MNKRQNETAYAQNMSRRRAVKIIGAVAGASCLPRLATADSSPLWSRWDGEVMGAVSSIKLLGPDPETSAKLVKKCLAQARRLEALFSLHVKDSAISRLNNQGYLDHPDRDFLELLRLSNEIHRRTQGAFDITVQPLWRLYTDHFIAKPEADPAGPDKKLLDETRRLIDQSAIFLSSKRIGFSRPGMQITLNGIAQGYISDRIAELLLQNNIDRVLVDMGETVVLGEDADGNPWKVGLLDPQRPFEISCHMEVSDMAIATSGAYGLVFDKAGRFHHILDARTGLSTSSNLAVTVTAPAAAMADGLSTAFSGMGTAEISSVIASHSNVGALVTDLDGRQIKLGNLPKIVGLSRVR